jgi:D-glycero-D-manno-heptose 1,7-bisphosphate phosphatase
MQTPKYIILDRDGVINFDSPSYIKCSEEWKPIPKSLEAMSLLYKHEYKIILISNQAGISRGIIKYKNHLEIHKKLINACKDNSTSIYATYYCYDHPDQKSQFRKPNPGMYLDIAARLNIDLSQVFAIGDSPRDIKASLSAGCNPLGVLTGNGKDIQEEMPNIELFNDLFDAVKFVIEYDKQYILNI